MRGNRPSSRLLGEAVTAFVVLPDGRNVGAEVLIEACLNRLSRYKVPKEVRFVRDLPRNAMGKVMRGRLGGDPIETEAGCSAAGSRP
ncbi:hypothetical protein [Bradyrhizobium sp. LHD-71]|uniref:AMP-binding enzyme n=1 Tax=Bradyrhizobium sp. LHD-71 TaxID=3072141 RepID=UPI0035BE3D76